MSQEELIPEEQSVDPNEVVKSVSDIKDRIYECSAAIPFSVHFYSDVKFRIPKPVGTLPPFKVVHERDALSDFVSLDVSIQLLEMVAKRDTQQKGADKFTRKERESITAGLHALKILQAQLLEPAFKIVKAHYQEQHPSE